MKILIRTVARGWWLAVMLAAASLPAFAEATEDGAGRIREIKAAFVLNVARFVNWPPASVTEADEMILCFYRHSILAGVEKSVTQNTVRARAVTTLTIQHLDGAAGCDLVLIPGSQVQRFIRESSLIAEWPILTIADLTAVEKVGLAYPGVHVNLVRRGNSIGVEVNAKDVNDAGFWVSSRLLKLARIVGRR